MNLITPIHIDKSNKEISSDSKVMTLGSCFSEHIGSKLLDSHFVCSSNPFSTVFNPISIGNLLTRSITKKLFTPEEVDQHNDRHFIYDLHSIFDATESQKTLETSNRSLLTTHNFLSDIDCLIITFGTTIGYHHIEQDRLVSNCHKVPNHQFERQFLDQELMYGSISTAIDQLLKIRPNLLIIFTVSPVRHTKEGLVDNNISKSKLILLCHALSAQYSLASYFPSYEIMMDELRDYRFYKEDMIHPTQQAVDIIWDRFKDTYFDLFAKEKVNDLQRLNRAFNHKPFDPNSKGHNLFCKKQLEELDRLDKKYPEVDFRKYEFHFGK
ncbi:MAG: hypothetical protein ACJATI_004267 [Halioglobus sp.]|jgi:hypothetical protein